jgi:hypothetical protein
MEKLKKILMEKKGFSSIEAVNLINETRLDVLDSLNRGEIPYNICSEKMGLSPDFIVLLMDY